MTTSRNSSVLRLFAVLLALLLVGAACGMSGEDGTSDSGGSFDEASQALDGDQAEVVETESDSGGDTAEESAADGEPAAADGGDLGAGGLADTAALQPLDIGRDIIFTATIDLEVESVPAASQEAMTAIQGLGGILFNQITTTDGVPRSTLTFKVQPNDFQTALARLGEIGFLRDQRISADDVTERVVDLQSQIITAEASVERLRGFLENAATLSDIAELERELLERETRLESLRGSLRTVQGQVDLATITITLTQKIPGPELTVVQTGYISRDGDITCPGDDELEVDEGASITVCYEIRNTGDTLLGEFFVRDEGLDIDIGDMTVVSGSLQSPLAVGASFTLAAKVDVEPGQLGIAQVTAVPVAEDGTDLRLGSTSARSDFALDVIEDTSLPGFLDGFSAGLAVLVVAFQAAFVSLGFLLPFIWVIPVAWWVRRWMQRRKAANEAAAREVLATIPPPTPTPTPTPAPMPTQPQPPQAPEKRSFDEPEADDKNVSDA